MGFKTPEATGGRSRRALTAIRGALRKAAPTLPRVLPTARARIAGPCDLAGAGLGVRPALPAVQPTPVATVPSEPLLPQLRFHDAANMARIAPLVRRQGGQFDRRSRPPLASGGRGVLGARAPPGEPRPGSADSIRQLRREELRRSHRRGRNSRAGRSRCREI